MKEAFLMGLLAMGANADDQDINLKSVLVPVNVIQNGEKVTVMKKEFHYSVTAHDTKADTAPSITRHITSPVS